MKLIRFGEEHQEKPGLLNPQGERIDLSGHFRDWSGDFFSGNGLEQLKAILSTSPVLPKVPASERWGACVARPGKIICIGLN